MSASKAGSISKTLLTPCRQVGLSRKRKTPSNVNNSWITKSETSGETPVKSLTRASPDKTPMLVDQNSLHTPINQINYDQIEKTRSTTRNDSKTTSIGRKTKEPPRSKDKSRKRVSRNLLLEDNKIEDSKVEMKEEIGVELQLTIENKFTNNDTENVQQCESKKQSMDRKSNKFRRILSTKSTLSSDDISDENKPIVQGILVENAAVTLVEYSNSDIACITSPQPLKDFSESDDLFVPSQDENKVKRIHKKVEKVEKSETKSRCRRILSSDSEDDDKNGNDTYNIDTKDNVSVTTTSLVTEKVDSIQICTPNAKSETGNCAVEKVKPQENPLTKVEDTDRKSNKNSKKLRRCLSIKKTDSFDTSMDVDNDCPKGAVIVLEKKCPTVEELSHYDINKIGSQSISKQIPEHLHDDDDFTSTPEEDTLGKQALTNQVKPPENPLTKVEDTDRKSNQKSKKLRRCLSIKKTDSFYKSMDVDNDCPKEAVIVLEKKCPTVEELSHYDVEKIGSQSITKPIVEHLHDDDDFTSTPEEDKLGRQELINQVEELEKRIKKKRDYLVHLNKAQTFEKKNNIDEVKNLFTAWKKGCIQVLNDLLPKLESHGNIDMPMLLKNLQIPPDIISISPKGELI